jgi:hypothetical protein
MTYTDDALNDAIRIAGNRQDQPRDANGGSKPNSGGADKSPKFSLTAFETIRPDFERRGYLVKGLLPNSGLAVIWGPPKCGKSFWATDLGLHLALGWEYRGRRVTQASVVYLALEGRYGLPLRSEAFRRHHGEQSAPFYLVTEQLDLVANVDALIACIETQLGAATKPGAVFIDTLNRSLVGSESKDEDMAAYLAAAGKIEQKFNCLVAIIHHCGIDATRPRGHTSLSGAVEVQLAVNRAASGEVVVTVELAKDFPEGAEIVSRLEPVDLGTDADGDPLTSPVVLPADLSAVIRQAPSRKLSDRQRLALAALDECAASPSANPRQRACNCQQAPSWCQPLTGAESFTPAAYLRLTPKVPVRSSNGSATAYMSAALSV